MRDASIWVTRDAVEIIHYEQLRAHGGGWGVRDENLLESALARPQQKGSYEDGVEMADLAAVYAFEIAKNHPFIDGNKRTAFVTMGVFLLANGIHLRAPEPEVVTVMLGVASGELGEPELAAWCRQRGDVTPA